MSFLLELTLRSTIVATIGLTGLLLLRSQSARIRVLLLRGVCLAMIALPALLLLDAKVLVPSPFPAEPLIASDSALVVTDMAANPSKAPVWPWIWLAGAALLCARHLASSLRLRQMWRLGRGLSLATRVELADALASMEVRRSTRARLTAAETPMVFGLSARLMLPHAFESWASERRRLALLHEAAHIRTSDSQWSHVASAMSVLYWWHPLAWAVTRSLRIEAELAADEAAIQSGFSGVRYAETLLGIARETPPTSPTYACSLLGVGTLRRRIRAALNVTAPRPRLLPKAMLLTSAIFVLATAVGGFAEPLQGSPAPSPLTQAAPLAPMATPPRPISAPQVAPKKVKAVKPMRPAKTSRAMKPVRPPRAVKPAKPLKPSRPMKAPNAVKSPNAFQPSLPQPNAVPIAAPLSPAQAPPKTSRSNPFAAPTSPAPALTLPAASDPLSRPSATPPAKGGSNPFQAAPPPAQSSNPNQVGATGNRFISTANRFQATEKSRYRKNGAFNRFLPPSKSHNFSPSSFPVNKTAPEKPNAFGA